LKIANQGLAALAQDKHLLNGLNVHDGKVTYKAVADDLGYDYVDPNTLL
jgi:alanine dehydrogenase